MCPPTLRQGRRVQCHITFNAISRKESCSVLTTHNKCCALILLFLDLLYSANNICWYRQPGGTFSTFEQAEGFTQGCPLSPFFACLVLHILLLADLNANLRHHPLTYQINWTLFPGDDSLGLVTQTKTYLMTPIFFYLTTPCLPWFLIIFAELAP